MIKENLGRHLPGRCRARPPVTPPVSRFPRRAEEVPFAHDADEIAIRLADGTALVWWRVRRGAICLISGSGETTAAGEDITSAAVRVIGTLRGLRPASLRPPSNRMAYGNRAPCGAPAGKYRTAPATRRQPGIIPESDLSATLSPKHFPSLLVGRSGPRSRRGRGDHATTDAGTLMLVISVIAHGSTVSAKGAKSFRVWLLRSAERRTDDTAVCRP